MKSFMIGIVLAIGCLILGAALHARYDSWQPNVVIEQTRISDQARREHYLMPQKDSPAYTEWVAKYGDSADSWELFTLSFHSRYLQELTKKVNALSNDANEPNQSVKAN